jgi:hypothetical protein
MIRDEQGSMSAFLAMLFLVFLLLISVCVEGIYMYTARGKAMGIYMSGLSHTKGNYQKELADMYHIYAMDPRYHKKIETDFSDRMKESLDQNGDPFRFQTGSTKISDILDLSAQKGEVLKYQIRQQIQYEAAGDILKNLTKKIKAGEDQKNEFSGIKDQIQKEEEEAEETENEKTLTSEPVKKDPRKGFMKLLKEGSVPLIMGEKKVSDLPINIVYGKKETTKQSAWNFMNRKDVEKELDEFEKTASTDSFASELPVVLYATKYFHFLTDTTKKDGIKYEIEYLIAGKDSEKENLGMVFWRMIALRFVMNAACVYQDPAKEKEAALLAASILGVTGFPPAVVVVKNLLLLALAYGESVIDVRNLAEGKKIPAVKTSSDWQLSFAGLATLNCKRKPVKQGMSYEDYLLLLLISQKDKRQKYFRMMDLMEQNIRRKVSDFKLDQCISSYKITQNLKLKKLGFGGMILPFATYTDLKMYRYVTY